jgi:hypothetical protein
MMPPLITLIGLLLAIFVLAECVNLFVVGESLTRGVIRFARQMLHGSKEITIPEDLKIAAVNGLLTVGSEVVVGDEHQWTGATVRRFAVSPSTVRAESGTILQIIRLTRNSMELKPLPNTENASTTKKSTAGSGLRG